MAKTVKAYESGSARYSSVFMEYDADWARSFDPIYIVTVGEAWKAQQEHEAKIAAMVAEVEGAGHKVEEFYDGEVYFGHTVVYCEGDE